MVFFVGGGGEDGEELVDGGEEGFVLGFEVEVEDEVGEEFLGREGGEGRELRLGRSTLDLREGRCLWGLGWEGDGETASCKGEREGRDGESVSRKWEGEELGEEGVGEVGGLLEEVGSAEAELEEDEDGEEMVGLLERGEMGMCLEVGEETEGFGVGGAVV